MPRPIGSGNKRPSAGPTRRKSEVESGYVKRARDAFLDQFNSGVQSSKRAFENDIKQTTRDEFLAPGSTGHHQPVFGEHWDEQDEAELQAQWHRSWAAKCVAQLGHNQQQLHTLWKVCIRLYKVDPFELLRHEPPICVSSNDVAVVAVEGVTRQSPIWSTNFCKYLTRIIAHPIWGAPATASRLKIVLILKWAIICRADDRRPLRFRRLTSCALTARLLEHPNDERESLPKVHSRFRKELRDGMLPEFTSNLMYAMAKSIRRDPLPTPERDAPYILKTQDLMNVIDALDSVGAMGIPLLSSTDVVYEMSKAGRSSRDYPVGEEELREVYANCWLSHQRASIVQRRTTAGDGDRSFTIEGDDFYGIAMHDLEADPPGSGEDDAYAGDCRSSRSGSEYMEHEDPSWVDREILTRQRRRTLGIEHTTPIADTSQHGRDSRPTRSPQKPTAIPYIPPATLDEFYASTRVVGEHSKPVNISPEDTVPATNENVFDTADDFKYRLAAHPTVPFDIGANTSGLDCLIQVIRHSYSLMATSKSLEKSDNPILDYVWEEFNPDRPATSAAQAEAKKQLFNILQQFFDRFDLPFWGLVTSGLMNDTLWSSPPWLAFRDTLYLASGESTWCLYDPPSRHYQGRSGRIKYDCRSNDETTLQQTVDNSFLPVSLGNGDFCATISNEPSFVRVEYTTGITPRSLADLRTFQMPVFDIAGSKRVQYGLVAVVRSRNNPQEHDYVRTYFLDGRPVAMANFHPSFMNQDWSLCDPGFHTYLLYYGRLPTVSSITQYPEVAPRAPTSEPGPPEPLRPLRVPIPLRRAERVHDEHIKRESSENGEQQPNTQHQHSQLGGRAFSEKQQMRRQHTAPKTPHPSSMPPQAPRAIPTGSRLCRKKRPKRRTQYPLRPAASAEDVNYCPTGANLVPITRPRRPRRRV